MRSCTKVWSRSGPRQSKSYRPGETHTDTHTHTRTHAHACRHTHADTRGHTDTHSVRHRHTQATSKTQTTPLSSHSPPLVCVCVWGSLRHRLSHTHTSGERELSEVCFYLSSHILCMRLNYLVSNFHPVNIHKHPPPTGCWLYLGLGYQATLFLK